MTLILTCLSRNFVVQASDRRVTIIEGPDSIRVLDDERNKAVAFKGVAAFGYTGLAEIGAEHRTDYWLLEAAAKGISADEAIDAIQAQAEIEFDSIRRQYPDLAPGVLRHAFVGGGWRRSPDGATWLPYVVTISNALTRGTAWSDVAHRNFEKFSAVLPPGESFYFHAAGAELTVGETNRLDRQVRRALARGSGPNAVGKLLVQCIRSAAARTNTVGKSILVVAIPRPGADRTALRIRNDGLFQPDAISSVYYPRNAYNPVRVAPHIVDQTGILFRDVVTFLPPREPVRPELPWARGPVVLSPRAKPREGRGIQPVICDDYEDLGFELVAEIQRIPARETPCVARVRGQPSVLSRVLGDGRVFVVVEGDQQAGAPATERWLDELGDWLARHDVDAVVLREFRSQARGRRRGEVVFGLINLFRYLSDRPAPRPPINPRDLNVVIGSDPLPQPPIAALPE